MSTNSKGIRRKNAGRARIPANRAQPHMNPVPEVDASGVFLMLLRANRHANKKRITA